MSYIVLIQGPKRQPLVSNNYYSTNSEMIKAAACEKYSNHPEKKRLLPVLTPERVTE